MARYDEQHDRSYQQNRSIDRPKPQNIARSQIRSNVSQEGQGLPRINKSVNLRLSGKAQGRAMEGNKLLRPWEFQKG